MFEGVDKNIIPKKIKGCNIYKINILIIISLHNIINDNI